MSPDRPDNPLDLILAVRRHETETGELPEGWHYGTEYEVDPRLHMYYPPGQVAVSPAIEEDGTLTQCFAWPDSYIYADFGELDLGIDRAPISVDWSFDMGEVSPALLRLLMGGGVPYPTYPPQGDESWRAK